MATVDHEMRSCSFCKKPAGGVQKLITCDEAAICNECVTVCVSVLIGENPPSSAEATLLREGYMRSIVENAKNILASEEEAQEAAKARYDTYEELAKSLENFQNLPKMSKKSVMVI